MKKFSIFLLAIILFIPNNVFAAKDITIKLDNKTVQTDVAPYIKDDRTFVPIRFISEALGYDVNWNEDTREVKITRNSNEIVLTIDKKNCHGKWQRGSK